LARLFRRRASAINFYIVNDVMGNSDGGQMASSDCLYKDASKPLIYMGPIWDFDISNGNYTAMTNPTVPWIQTQGLWYARWFQDPGFNADVTSPNGTPSRPTASSTSGSLPFSSKPPFFNNLSIVVRVDARRFSRLIEVIACGEKLGASGVGLGKHLGRAE
jgi:hypothetical protein